jgi:hypothetical protein
MVKNVIGSIGAAGRRLVRNWRVSLVILALYLAMLLAVYLFVSTMVATIGQLVITGITALAAPLMFFVIQGMGVSYMDDEQEAARSGAVGLMVRSLKGFWKLVLISVPFLLLAWLLIYLLGKIPPSTPAAATAPHVAVPAAAHTAAKAVVTAAHVAARPSPQPTDWRGVAITALQFLLFGIALPLAAINLWIAAARDGLGHAIKRAHRTLYKSFSPGTMLIYLVGLLIFGLMPYLLVGMHPPIKGELIEVGQLGIQLALAALLALFGWILTLGALSQRQKSWEAAVK